MTDLGEKTCFCGDDTARGCSRCAMGECGAGVFFWAAAADMLRIYDKAISDLWALGTASEGETDDSSN